MEIVLSQLVRLKTLINGFTELKKSFESNVIPHKGDYIEDSVWKADDEQEVRSVTINYRENYSYVKVPTITLETEDQSVLEQYEDMAKLHGWSSSSSE